MFNSASILSAIASVSFLLLSAGCTSYSQTFNQPQKNTTFSMAAREDMPEVNIGDYSIFMTFSGGGTRAAAFSYGVLKKLNALKIKTDSANEIALIKEVDAISAVSGGSFTAAYYGLYGERIFKEYEKQFLKHDIRHGLLQRLFNPTLWFTKKSRTDEAAEYYQSTLFGDATISDFYRSDTPMIIINASDLGQGVRFSFIQEYFDLLCSDVNSYPVASAVAASSAVPVVFNPVVLKNYQNCMKPPLLSLTTSETDNPMLQSTLHGLLSYRDKEKRQYIHLVDGGITDNLGLLAMYDIIEMNGGGKNYFNNAKRKATPHFLILSVDASTKPETRFESSNTEPSIAETVSAMSDIQLHRYNAATKNLLSETMKEYADIVSSDKIQVETYFVDINLSSIKNKELRQYINAIPTSLTLKSEQVDALIEQGESQLMAHPEFQRFLKNIGYTL